ncbi:1,2-dihydroxy-3-keto-5-methylthiopentene dioxygenase [Coemansia spiralis]|uniref:1,2-dihydroxy-3-keto-5-methylthiopentene dioxygenase n=1 Tax=Coemansia spiralis TaxID=417178 RepID=A0A9W8L1L8_9FUNG|nr:1,2-dihydroxy-3-keto-5-methylthiopentene dioxygenase [Coemansia spiralis]
MSFSAGSGFERAMAAMQTEWRRFEVERAEWDVERIRLKAKLSAAEKRIEHLSSLYRVSQKQVTALEHLLSEARTAPASEPSVSNEGPSDDGVTIAQLVAVTQSTRQRSRELLGRCLGEIEVLLGSSAPAAEGPLAEGGGLPSGVTLLKREPSVPNGVIESDEAQRAQAGDWQRLVSPPPLYANIELSGLSSLQPPLRDDVDERLSDAPLPLVDVVVEGEPRPIRKIAERRRRISQPPAASPVAAAELAPRPVSVSFSEEKQETPLDAASGIAGSWQCKKTFVGHMDSIRSLAMRNEGQQVLSGSDDGLVVLWDVERSDRRKSRRQRTAGDVVPAAMFRGHLAAVTSVAFADGHDFAYSASLDSTVKAWRLAADADDVAGSFPVRSFSHEAAVWDLALSPDAAVLASVAADGSCGLWSTQGEPLRTIRGDVVPVSTCFVDGLLAVAFVDGTVGVCDVAMGNGLLELGNLGSRIVRVAGAEHSLAVACVSGDVHLVDVRSKDTTRVRAHDQAMATAADLGSGSALMVTGASDGVVKWWDRRQLRSSVYEDAAHICKGSEGVNDWW